MRMVDWFRAAAAAPSIGRIEPTPPAPVAAGSPAVQAHFVGDAMAFTGLDDPLFREFLRGGSSGVTQTGITVTPKAAMKNTTVLRCVSLISFAIGTLPLHLRRRADKSKATDHPLFRVLHRLPNPWQTAFEFRTLMQQRLLTHGDAFALIVRSGPKILHLVPIDNERVEVRQRADWTLEYRVSRKDGGPITYPQREIFHVRYGLSEDGITGMSLVKQAAEAIGLAIQGERAAAKLFEKGVISGLTIKHPKELSEEAYARLKASLEDREGAGNAYRSMILEEGMDIVPPQGSGRDAQATEQRKLQTEEIARPFGVPRPLLFVDETSWGSGIDVLGQFFVRYALNPMFEAWQQAIVRDLLTDDEADELEPKFNAAALLHGSMKDQAEFFAKGLGAGGSIPWMHPDEPREIMDMTARDDLPPRLGDKTGESNDPAPTS